ncbi:hypothetical protein D9613_009990 [Agrocybe pediades]|uniref:Uncharacterized protein n=1 Tax=Agrocybe pediades TaxID=84607 RepID=A0A8H4QX73_9AGAR|nr:hypothetical protein D9613_009990 [Agrocybe pediades]
MKQFSQCHTQADLFPGSKQSCIPHTLSTSFTPFSNRGHAITTNSQILGKILDGPMSTYTGTITTYMPSIGNYSRDGISRLPIERGVDRRRKTNDHLLYPQPPLTTVLGIMITSDLLSSTPLSLYAIPAMWVISYYPAVARTSAIKKAGQFNNVQPRASYASAAGKKEFPPAVAARIQRLEGAHNNGLENLPFFGLAILAGNLARMDTATLNIASGLYLVSRLAYNYFYVNQHDQKTAGLRSLTWGISLTFPFYILFKSASLLAH